MSYGQTWEDMLLQDPDNTTTSESDITFPTTNLTTEKPGTTTLPPPGPARQNVAIPIPVIVIVLLWVLLIAAYAFTKWRQRAKAIYIIPRVFVLCSPRTVQLHYEMILRIGMPSADYNPDKHDIDLTVLGTHRNEVVPMTRLNTKTLLDEPLITSLSMIVYRLVEMPALGSLVLRHSGPFKAWVYVYDFTVIDLSSNKEMYYTINKYIGSINRIYALEEHNELRGVHYPIDDVPLPAWTTEDIFLVMAMSVNCIMLSITLLPLSCGLKFLSDLATIGLASANAGAVIFFLQWLLYYYARWNSDRREYFNLNQNSGSCWWFSIETIIRYVTGASALVVAGVAIYFSLPITSLHDSLVWILATTCTIIIVIGLWNIARLTEMCEAISNLGLRCKRTDSVPVGMRVSEIVSDIQTKSGSASDEDGSRLAMTTSKFARSFGPRSSVKSFGFDALTGHPSRGPKQPVRMSEIEQSAHEKK